MAHETMTSEERIWAAIRLEKPDRVPIMPLLTPVSCAHLIGWKQARIVYDPNAGLDAMVEVFRRFGPFDGVNTDILIHPADLNLSGMKSKLAGRDLAEDTPWQAWEQELIAPEDYDKIAEIGWYKFLLTDLIYRTSDEIKKPEDLSRVLAERAAITARAREVWSKLGCYDFLAGGGNHPFFSLSLTRSMVKFTEDLYYQPDKVERALKRMAPECATRWAKNAKERGRSIVFVVEERAGAFFYPLKIFERFWWPYTKQIVDMLWSEGVVSWFHLDTCWDKNLPYFKELPKGSAVIDLDGTTNIFAAKELLRDHLCICSDVHPALLSVGKPEEVESYCKKLIDELGDDGGHILGSGCEVPYACKPENLKAMVETGRTYQFSKQ